MSATSTCDDQALQDQALQAIDENRAMSLAPSEEPDVTLSGQVPNLDTSVSVSAEDPTETALNPIADTVSTTSSTNTSILSSLKDRISTGCAMPNWNFHFESSHKAAKPDAPPTGWPVEGKWFHVRNDDCGKGPYIHIWPSHLHHAYKGDCDAWSDFKEIDFDLFSGPNGSYVMQEGDFLVTPIQKEKCDPTHGRMIAAEANQARKMWQKWKDDQNKPQGINVIVNNTNNNEVSNKSENNITGPNITMGGNTMANSSAPVMQAMPAMAAAPPSPAPGYATRVDTGGLDEADEMFTCQQGAMGFNLDWNRTDKRVVAVVNEGSWAEKKEFTVGDEIVSIDGKSAVSMSQAEIVALLKDKRPLKVGLKKTVAPPEDGF